MTNADEGAFGGQAVAGELSLQEAPDPRGQMHRKKRLMPDADTREFLRAQHVAHVGTVDAKGWPYVVPLIYIYEGNDYLYLHTGNHHGHFLQNIQRNPRVCVEVRTMGPVHRGHPFACNSDLALTSVIAFGPVRLITDQAKKSWFFDQVLASTASRAGRLSWGIPFSTALFCMNNR